MGLCNHTDCRPINPCAVLCLFTQSYTTLCNPMNCSPPGSPVHGGSSGKNTGMGCHILLQGIFPTWRLNPDLPHCKWILYHLNHQESPADKPRGKLSNGQKFSFAALAICSSGFHLAQYLLCGFLQEPDLSKQCLTELFPFLSPSPKFPIFFLFQRLWIMYHITHL